MRGPLPVRRHPRERPDIDPPHRRCRSCDHPGSVQWGLSHRLDWTEYRSPTDSAAILRNARMVAWQPRLPAYSRAKRADDTVLIKHLLVDTCIKMTSCEACRSEDTSCMNRMCTIRRGSTGSRHHTAHVIDTVALHGVGAAAAPRVSLCSGGSSAATCAPTCTVPSAAVSAVHPPQAVMRSQHTPV